MPKPSLMWNAIVKNESGRILRAAASVLPYIKSYSILDTGSDDNTTDLIRDFFDAAGIKGRIHFGYFKNFSQARNDAFAHAQMDNCDSELVQCDFALLMDADMELRVTDPTAFEPLNDPLAISFDMMQKAGPMSYANRRVLNLSWDKPPYVGVTHEYMDVPAKAMIHGADFLDHADGANRPEKFVRDIALLEEGLKDDPNNGRYIYYLANSYRDAGEFKKAAETYQRRIDLGGWDEETHSAMMHLGSCEKELRNFGGFVDAMLQAYNFRPQRAEPLYELAKAYRDRNQQRTGLIFAKAGLNHTRPSDVLFVNDYVYEHGLRYEYSIMGFYDPLARDAAFHVTNDLALDLSCPEGERNSSRSNLQWFAPKLSEVCTAFRSHEINFQPKRGYTAMNPSVCRRPNGGLEVLLRTVNYKINEHGQYMIGEKGCNDAPIDTENWLLMVDDDLTTKDYAKVVWERPAAKFPLVTGLEDMRLFWNRGTRMFSATVREQSATGQCEMWTGELSRRFGNAERAVVEHAEMISDGVTTQKNWMPLPSPGLARWMYDVKTMYEPGSQQWAKTDYPRAIDNLRGSSQLIPFKGGYLAVVHEATYRGGKRVYLHRFVHFTKDLYPARLSLPFVFEDVQIEFCAGLSDHRDPNLLVLSYGVRDEKAMLATVPIEQVAQMLGANR